jgi:hypothetical protein
MSNPALSNEPLTSFAEIVAQSVLDAFPHWKAYLRNSPAGEFTLEIPLGHRTDQPGVLVQTDSDLEYIIVGIGPGHAELADWNNKKEITELAQDAIRLVQAILQEQYIGAKLTTGNALLGTEEIEHSDIQTSVSWLGTYDRG